MRVITINLNGIRSAARKGFFSWLEQQQADVVCVQETKAHLDKLEDEIFRPKNFHCYFSNAEKLGYSGVGIYSHIKPNNVSVDFVWPLATQEGRYLRADFGNDLSVISVYLPSGSSGEQRQAIKFEFLEYFLPHLKQLQQEKRQFIICGDWNIAHRTIDIKNWRSNQKNSGFLPEERVWLDHVIYNHGWVDAFREVNQQAEQYTWWSNRGEAWAKNVGWRIDYQIVSPALKPKIKHASVYKDQRFSDHAPLIVDYE